MRTHKFTIRLSRPHSLPAHRTTAPIPSLHSHGWAPSKEDLCELRLKSISEMQKEGKKINAPKREGKRQRKRASMTRTEVTSFSPARVVQTRKSSDMSNSNLPYKSSQVYVLVDQPSKKLWQCTDSKCYSIKERNLNGVHQALLLKSWTCMKAGPDMNRHRQERHSRMKKSLPFTNN